MFSVAPYLSPNEICTSIRSMFALFFHGGQIGERLEHPASGEPPLAAYELHEHTCAERAAVEEFISRRFFETFGSRVEAFMPRLFSLRDRNGRICGAFGLRSAQRRLFLEQYLDSSIEGAIAERTGLKAERRNIVEIGHFSGSFPGAMRIMIHLLTEFLYREGFHWVAFTGTTGLRNSFVRLGLPLIDIQAAERERLPLEERAAWGSYYDHAPRVVVGKIRVGHDAFAQTGAHIHLGKREAA
jgi:hypothetical protein